MRNLENDELREAKRELRRAEADMAKLPKGSPKYRKAEARVERTRRDYRRAKRPN